MCNFSMSSGIKHIVSYASNFYFSRLIRGSIGLSPSPRFRAATADSQGCAFVSYYYIFVCHFACVWPTALELGGITNFGTFFLVRGSCSWLDIKCVLIGDVRVAFRLCFKASPSAKPFIWKLVLFTFKLTKLCI